MSGGCVRKILDLSAVNLVDVGVVRFLIGCEDVRLTPLEFKILRFLLKNADRVVSRDELLKEVFGYDQDPPLSRNVDLHFHLLRRKLEREPAILCTSTRYGVKATSLCVR